MACGGGGLTKKDCRWCDSGYQSVEQQAAWNRFRTGMRKMSATYDFLETTVEHVLSQLNELGPAGDELWARGTVLLDQWRAADAGGAEERSRLAGELQAWMQFALNELRPRP